MGFGGLRQSWRVWGDGRCLGIVIWVSAHFRKDKDGPAGVVDDCMVAVERDLERADRATNLNLPGVSTGRIEQRRVVSAT